MEAIDAKLLTHNEDPSAHGQAGEVVEVHRSDTELDHVDGSIAFKKLASSNSFFITSFESLDGWTKVGTPAIGIFALALATTAVLNNATYIWAEGQTPTYKMSFLKNPFFQTSFALTDLTTQLIYVRAGDNPIDARFDNFGFKIVNGTLYAHWTNGGAENNQEIAGITLTDFNVYRAEVDSANSKIYFSVNGVLKYTATTNFPTTNIGVYFCYYIKTTTAGVRGMVINSLMWMQDI